MNQNTWTDYSNYFEEKKLIAGFTNRYFPYQKPIDRIEFAKILGLDTQHIVSPKQIHSSEVIFCSKFGECSKIDGTISSRKEFVLSIQVADCIPIFVYDNNLNIYGLVHAGWRGVTKSIVKNTIDKLNDIGSKMSNVQILLGPSIRQCCFEIGPEVAELFDGEFLLSGKGDRSFLDLQGYIINKFRQFGVKGTHIIDIAECTCCSDNYHSYRRDGKQAGRMIAMMGFQN